jgi:hypothetical protein
MQTRSLTAVLPMLLLAGCAATTPAPRFSTVSAADAEGPEGGMPPPTLALAGEAEAKGLESTPDDAKPAGGHEGHSMPSAPAPSEGIYSCPMHPEVRQKSPGSCPKCGMPLVKRKDEGRQP